MAQSTSNFDCRECGGSTNKAAHVVLPAGPKGGRRICINCVERLMGKGDRERGIFPVGNLRDFIANYLKVVKPETVQALKARIRELEVLLQDANYLINGSSEKSVRR